jgi:hypothetical protein
VFAVDSSFESPAFIYQTSLCHFPERGYCVSHHRENSILCIGSFRYESLPLVLRQEGKYILKDRDSLGLSNFGIWGCDPLDYHYHHHHHQHQGLDRLIRSVSRVTAALYSDLVINCFVANSESSSHITITKADTVNSVDLTF